MAKRKKLNSMRLLDARSVPYQVIEYDPAIRDAQAVAATMGYPAGEVFKTLVVMAAGKPKPILVMLPADRSLNLKRLAKALGEKKMALAPHADAEKLTGLQVGGISALALVAKNWAVYLDQRAETLDQIVISAGRRGLQLRLRPRDLAAVLGCPLLDVAD